MKNLKTRIAATATVVGLGGLAGVALSAGGQKASTLASKPQVRTQVVRRTVHVTKHAKPKHPVATGGAGYAGSPGHGASATTGASSTGSGSSSSGSSPVTTSTSGSEAGSGGGGGTPVTTAPSGTGSTGGGEPEDDGGKVEHESESGGDD